MTNDSADDTPPTSGPFGSREVRLVQRVRAFISDRFGDTRPYLLIGYSGGADSLALLLTMRDLARLDMCSIVAVHVDHRLRNESEQDAELVASVARSLGVDVMIWRSADRPEKLFPGVGIEEAARRARFGAFRDVAADAGADAVLLGHHARDQAETVLLHLMRGSGLDGLSGMADDTTLDVPWWGGDGRYPLRVLRPLLTEDPDELRRVADQSGLPIVEDRSNDDPAYRRNRVRHELLPLMEDIAAGSVARVAGNASVVRADNDVLDRAARVILNAAQAGSGLGWSQVAGEPLGMQRRVIRRWIGDQRGLGDLSLSRVDAVIALSNRRRGGKRVEIGGGWAVIYRNGALDLVAPEAN